MKTFEELQKLIIPPDRNSVIGSKNQWGNVTATFGKSLPTDYMLFIDRYGSGEIGNWLTILNPFSQNSNTNLIDSFPNLLASIASLKEEFPEYCPYNLMFEPGGLLPWGISIDGDIFCWTTAGVSGNWKIVIICRHSDHEEYSLSMSQFLIQAVSGIITSAAIPENWANEKIRFTSYV